MDRIHVQDHLEAYLLGWLDDAQRQSVETHMVDCAVCRQALQEVEETLALLPIALAERSSLAMPAGLRGQVVEAIATQSEPAIAAQPASAPRPAPSTTMAPQLRTNARQRPERAHHARSLRWAFALATVLLAIAILWGIRLNVVLARERALRIEFGELVDQQEVVLEVIDSNETTRRVLLPPDFAPGGEPGPYGKVFTRADMTHVVAMVGRLPEPPAGTVYYLWLVAEDETRLAGEMLPNEEGFALLIYEAIVDGPEFTRAFITLQPPGARAPNAPPILTWPRES